MDPHESASHAPVDCPSVGPASFAAELPYSATTGTLHHDCDVVNDPLHGELSGSLGHVDGRTPYISTLVVRVVHPLYFSCFVSSLEFLSSLHFTVLHFTRVLCRVRLYSYFYVYCFTVVQSFHVLLSFALSLFTLLLSSALLDARGTGTMTTEMKKKLQTTQRRLMIMIIQTEGKTSKGHAAPHGVQRRRYRRRRTPRPRQRARGRHG